MFKNYIITAWRSLIKNKFYTIINVSGLAVGLATAIMLLLWVENELSFDKFNKDYKNIYELSSHFPSDGNDKVWNGVPGPLAVYAKAIPSIKSLVRIGSEFDQNFSNKDRSKIFDGNKIGYVDSGFFSIFNYRLLDGNTAKLFANTNSVIITQATAQKLFGNQNAVGKIMGFRKEYFTITGVLQNFPQNSSLQFDAIFPMAYYGRQFTANGGNGDWKTIDEDLGDYAFTTFVKLQPGTDAASITNLFSAVYKKARNGDSKTQFEFQNLADIHLVTPDGNTSSLRMVQIFMLVVILLASVQQLLMLISKEFLKLVVIAFLIAVPLTYWLMNDWLQNYHYRINISIWLFVIVGICMFVLTLVVVSMNTIKAAMANPVKSLRTE